MIWESYIWMGWVALFVIFEAIGLLLRHENEGVTLTYFIEHHIPRWILAGALGWLAYHFLVAGLAEG
jgi:hypothetical protein